MRGDASPLLERGEGGLPGRFGESFLPSLILP